jgi:hypothetical protein
MAMNPFGGSPHQSSTSKCKLKNCCRLLQSREFAVKIIRLVCVVNVTTPNFAGKTLHMQWHVAQDKKYCILSVKNVWKQ